MFTTEQLARHAGLSKRKITALHRDGFLPSPVGRPGNQGRRGRGQYLFPDEALDVARWHQARRRSIHGTERVKVWLWMEGYDYVEANVAVRQRDVRERMGQVWQSMRAHVPALPVSPLAPSDDETRNRVLDDIDEAITRPIEKEYGEAISAAYALLGAGVLDAPVYPVESDTVKTLAAAVERVRNSHANRLSIPALPNDALPSLKNVLEAINLRRGAQQSLDLDYARLLWQALVAITELSKDRPEPLYRFLRAVRHFLYSMDPHLVLHSLAVMAPVFAKKEEVAPMAQLLVTEWRKRRACALAVTTSA